MHWTHRPALVVLPVLLACAVTVTGSRGWFERGYREGILRRASFDLSCPANQLSVTPVGSRTSDALPEGDFTAVGLAGCDKKATYVYVNNEWVMNNTSSNSGGAPTGKALLADVKAMQEKVAIAQRHGDGPGLGDSLVTVAGKPVWPPSGDGCQALVSCCNAQSMTGSGYSLFCQLAVARDTSCTKAKDTITKISAELGDARPAACGP